MTTGDRAGDGRGAGGRPVRPALHEKHFLRKLAHWGATRGPDWWVRLSPPVFGWAAAALVPSARRAVRRNLTRVRGPASPVRDAADVLTTFGTYASCLAEVLSNDKPEGPREPRGMLSGMEHVEAATGQRRGVVLVTLHTAGWESAGQLLASHFDVPLMIVMEAEPDRRAMSLQDQARQAAGIEVVHVGDDPLSSLPLLRHLRGGGVVALQLDRVVPGMRTRRVRMFGGDAEIPEGPLRLAQLSGAPLLAIFCARRGYRRYAAFAHPPIQVARAATDEDLDRIAQRLADDVTAFLREHPTQWFMFK